MINKRTVLKVFLKCFGMAGIALAMPLLAFAQSSFSTVSLGDRLTLISGAGTNVVIAEGADSVVVVNGGHREHAEALLAQINELTGNKPISALFNTNWREEHSGLNHLLGPQGVPIIAHENTRLWQTAEFYQEWRDVHVQPLPEAAQASETIYKSGTLTLGDEVIEYGFISQGTTDGDIHVHFKNADVLVVGDLIGTDAFPLLDYVTGGWIGGAQKAIAGLIEKAGPDTKVIASTGPVLDVSALEEHAAMFDHAYASVAEAFKTGRSLEQFMLTMPMAEYSAKFGDPELFLTLLYKGTWYHVPGRAVPGII